MQSIISLGNVVPIEIYRLPTCSSFFIQLLIPHDAKQLLLKNILSPKCISPVPKSLSPGVNLRLYHHSTETETHIYFISKMAKSFDLLGFSRQKADCLHMKTLRKHITPPHTLQLIAVATKHLQISCQCGRITTYIYHFLWIHLNNGT